MYLYVEMWNAKPEWLALSRQQREEFMDHVAVEAAGLAPLGAELLGAWINDADVDQRLDRTYFTVFKFPSKGAIKSFEDIVRGSGWYDYFDQKNSSGPIETFAEVMAHALTL